jgi:hypothetical protein
MRLRLWFLFHEHEHSDMQMISDTTASVKLLLEQSEHENVNFYGVVIS